MVSWKQRYLVTHWRGKQQYQVTNGMKSTIVTFATMTFKPILTNRSCKLFLGLERKHKHETYTLCLIKFLSAHISFILADYQGREWQGWGTYVTTVSEP